MEKEGLVRTCSYLQNAGLTIDVLITDRHLQIQKWIRECLPLVKHYFDVWHVAKGIDMSCYMAVNTVMTYCLFKAREGS